MGYGNTQKLHRILFTNYLNTDEFVHLASSGFSLTPYLESFTPILGLGTPVFQEISSKLHCGTPIFPTNVFGTPIFKILVRTLSLEGQ